MAVSLQADNASVILGATSGVGQSVARSLERSGNRLLLLGRDLGKLEIIRNNLDQPYKHHCAVIDDWHNLFDLTVKISEFEDMYNVVTNSGIYTAGVGPLIPLKALTWENIDHLLQINTIVPLMFVSRLTEYWSHRKTEGAKSIVIIASVSAHRGQKGFISYGGTKSALLSGIKSLALEIAPNNIRLNCVSPGWLDTKANREAENTVPGLRERMYEEHPLGLGSSSDGADLVNFLLSEKAKWITGTDVTIDGGFLAG
jgi:NAD(P)-dependent dehydrogenase (short-subunit alcohol dehydrogenase family)